jgi:hypothetical protein
MARGLTRTDQKLPSRSCAALCDNPNPSVNKLEYNDDPAIALEGSGCGYRELQSGEYDLLAQGGPVLQRLVGLGDLVQSVDAVDGERESPGGEVVEH